ncbi:PD40 domain-containing protein [Mucilaginibacter sp. AK015]|uniref:TolB family protein n=1 Tax=Mucilaginibacter sp. AK015 TaxID=2723072 RepID=UPI00161B0C5E|nr:PD40 domain-containing protein [Mucilaginibacter sp. AK015]MBB5394014.1 Tol biopolymer transport system component [Mucilaginibacter sp. AK015]
MLKKTTCVFAGLLAGVIFVTAAFAQNKPIGIFDGNGDIGAVKNKGSVIYNAAAQQYTVAGSGTNIWFNKDEFHFVWKRMKGDFILRTNAAFIGKGTEAHRKFGLMVRKSLAGNSAHVNAVVHGDGLTSLQYRAADGDSTKEQKSAITAAGVIQLERKGKTYTMSAARKGDVFGPEERVDIDLGDEVYVGIFVCSHNPNVVEKTVFNNVRIVVPAPASLVAYKQYLGSNIEVLDMQTQNSRIIYQSPKSLQAPNWMVDGKSLIYNSEGLLYKYNLATNAPAVLNTGSAKGNNNDHVLSFDGKWLTISNNDNGAPSVGYVVPVTGGEPRRVTETGKGASYMHGWSPDGKYLVFCGERNKEYDVYRVPVAGGHEERLTNTPGLDDGPEYTPDGQYIYFNSVRTGLMQVWRMKADGTEQTQITNDDYNNWFPHVSPDGKWIVYITFLKNEVAPGDHPFYKHVYIRVMPVGGGPSKVVAYLYGGQGTINTPSWSPDSKHIAFVSNTNLLFPAFPISKH